MLVNTFNLCNLCSGRIHDRSDHITQASAVQFVPLKRQSIILHVLKRFLQAFFLFQHVSDRFIAIRICNDQLHHLFVLFGCAFDLTCHRFKIFISLFQQQIQCTPSSFPGDDLIFSAFTRRICYCHILHQTNRQDLLCQLFNSRHRIKIPVIAVNLPDANVPCPESCFRFLFCCCLAVFI